MKPFSEFCIHAQTNKYQTKRIFNIIYLWMFEYLRTLYVMSFSHSFRAYVRSAALTMVWIKLMISLYWEKAIFVLPLVDFPVQENTCLIVVSITLSKTVLIIFPPFLSPLFPWNAHNNATYWKIEINQTKMNNQIMKMQT